MELREDIRRDLDSVMARCEAGNEDGIAVGAIIRSALAAHHHGRLQELTTVVASFLVGLAQWLQQALARQN